MFKRLRIVVRIERRLIPAGTEIRTGFVVFVIAILVARITVHAGDSGVVYSVTTTGLSDDVNTLPEGFYLGQNYPNPFNPLTVIQYGVPEKARVMITLYDVLGRELVRLVDEVQDPGVKNITFDARSLSTGVYTYRITIGKFTESKKMVVIK